MFSSPQKREKSENPSFQNKASAPKASCRRHPVVPSGGVGAAQLPASVKAPGPHSGHAARKGLRGEPMPSEWISSAFVK